MKTFFFSFCHPDSGVFGLELGTRDNTLFGEVVDSMAAT